MTKESETKYRIRNWSEYNKALVQRGSINLWFSEESIEKWHFCKPDGKKGRPLFYSNDAILCALIIRTVFHLPLRALQGFLLSMVILLGLAIKIPSYTQISRRSKDLGKVLKKLSNRRPSDIVFDSTGLKVYGEGEWKVKKHGTSKRRTWRKLHIGMDPNSGEIIIAELTGNAIGDGDGQVGQKLLKKSPRSIKRVFGDGGYDGLGFRKEVEEIGAEPIIPPPKGAVIRENPDRAQSKRNDSIAEIQGLGGDEEARKFWKILKGYHKRSLVETSMYRIKQLTGSNLKSRSYDRQRTEAQVKCLVINKMTKLGMPVGRWEMAS